MSRMRISAVAAGLSAGLLFYIAHRSDQTLCNRIARWILGPAWYGETQEVLRQLSPVPAVLHGCLPSALWCWVVAGACGAWSLRIGARRVPLAWAAAGINAFWEVVQASGWSNGRADPLDVAAGFAGCAASRLLLGAGARNAEFPPGLNWRTGVALACVACMGMAAVTR